MDQYVETVSQHRAQAEFAELFRQLGSLMNVVGVAYVALVVIIFVVYGVTFLLGRLEARKNEEGKGP